MSPLQGTLEDPWYVEEEHDTSFSPVDDDPDPEPLEVIEIDDTEVQKTPQQRLFKNGPISYPDIELDVYQKNAGLVIHPGDTVELEDLEERQTGAHNSGDFLKVKHIIHNVETEKVRLRGHLFRRTKYLGPIFDWRVNELALCLNIDENDPRCPFVSGMEERAVEEVTNTRELVLTDKSWELVNWRHDRQHPCPYERLTKYEWLQIIYHQYRLTCRHVFIQTPNKAGKSYSGVVRWLYSHEIESTPSSHPPLYQPSSRSSSMTLVGDDDDEVIVVGKASKRPRRDSLEELKEPPKRTLRSPSKPKRYSFADIFCGAGGASRGALQAGLIVTFGLDIDKYAIKAYRLNYRSAKVLHMDAHDFMSLSPDELKRLKVDILHLSPPCCFWSAAHTSFGKNDQANYEALYTVGAILNKLKPQIATLEQTSGLLTHHIKNLKLLLWDIQRVGYNVRYKIQDISEFGVPQRRMRLLIIAARRGKPLPPFPAPTHGFPGSGLKQFTSIYDALRDMRTSSVNLADKYHQTKRSNKPQEPYDPKTRMLRGCITTSGGENYDPSGLRRFTPRELSLFQTFPYGYHFTGFPTEATKQIGNAFPPRMAEALLKNCAKTLEAFDNGFISAEDDFVDLDEFLYANNIRIPHNSGSGTSTSPYRYLKPYTPPSRSSNGNPFLDTSTKRPLFCRGSEILDYHVRLQQKKRTSLNRSGTSGYKDENIENDEEDEEEEWETPFMTRDGKLTWQDMPVHKKKFWSEVYPEIIELD